MNPRLYDPLPRWRSARARAEFPQAEFEKVREDLLDRVGRWYAWRRRINIVVAVVILVALGVFIDRKANAFSFDLWPALFGALLVGFWIFREWSAKYRFPPAATPDRIVAAMLRHGRCPSCAYPLSAPGPDGRVVCSECGAAWGATIEQ